jgi:16S rRNA (cytosine967-C5)-methyltransferase
MARSRPPRKPPVDAPGAEARRVAIEAVRRIDEEGAYANLLLATTLADSPLDQRDRNLVTELVYGTTRMRRAVDWLVDRFLVSPPGPALRASLRVGAYQLAFMRVPAHAAVSATVSASAKRNRAPVNAILRKVADSIDAVEWPSLGIRLSYPDWIIGRLSDDLGAEPAIAMLEQMNLAPSVHERDDGYIQDEASQWVVEAVGAQPGERVLDLCAAPGGKATGLAALGAQVTATDSRVSRSSLVAANIKRLGITNATAITADGRHPPFRAATFDRILVDAPCSGLGVLRRRADARWRVTPKDIENLAVLQGELIDAAVTLLKPGGVLVYSVCTVTMAETVTIAEAATGRHELVPIPIGDERWTAVGTGARLLPQDHDTDAMVIFAWTTGAASD